MSSGRKTLLIGLLIFVVALVPRALPRYFLTTDETINWIGRSERFLLALQEGRLENTVQAFHPGVTTTWLGAAGILLSRATQPPDVDFVTYLTVVRLPIILVNALCIVISYWLLRRLINPRVAFLAGLLWATEPFIVAHSAILHVDALSTSLMTVALLSGWYALDRPIRWPLLIFSAVVGGFGGLTKFTTLFIFPLLPLYSLLDKEHLPTRPLVTGLAVWIAVAVIVWFAFFPATWVNMFDVLSMLNYGKDLALSPHESGNFFLGQPVQDPGIFFYPLAIVLRLAPYTLIGVAAALFNIRHHRKIVFSLLFTSVAFLVLMTFQPKKFDRYVLQVFPLLDIVAACGLIGLIDAVRARLSVVLRPAFAWVAVVVVLIFNLAAYHPYYLAYYNPLLGGSSTAVRTILVGWGEGLDQIVRYLRQQHRDCTYNLVTDLPGGAEILQFYFPCEQVDSQTTYIITYISQVQRQQGQDMQTVEPLFTVRLQGIDYAAIYDAADLPLNLKP